MALVMVPVIKTKHNIIAVNTQRAKLARWPSNEGLDRSEIIDQQRY